MQGIKVNCLFHRVTRFHVARLRGYKVVVVEVIQVSEGGALFRILVPTIEHHIIEGGGYLEPITSGTGHTISLDKFAENLGPCHPFRTITRGLHLSILYR